MKVSKQTIAMTFAALVGTILSLAVGLIASNFIQNRQLLTSSIWTKPIESIWPYHKPATRKELCTFLKDKLDGDQKVLTPWAHFRYQTDYTNANCEAYLASPQAANDGPPDYSKLPIGLQHQNESGVMGAFLHAASEGAGEFFRANSIYTLFLPVVDNSATTTTTTNSTTTAPNAQTTTTTNTTTTTPSNPAGETVL